MRVSHRLPLRALCPVTGNPQAGSELVISYVPAAVLLDVFGLAEVIQGYVGHQQVRDIEYMVQHVTQRFANVLDVAVTVSAHIVLDIDQGLDIEAIAEPMH
ncbi:MAG: hypothetical protein ACOCX5_02695 [Chloroflexota bacterium]